VHCELVAATGFKCVDPGMIPNIGSVAAMAAEFNVVDVRAATDFENRDQFMLGPIKRPHATIVLVPDAKVDEVAIEGSHRGQKLEQVAPIHAT
jgi:hypothetical protein